MLLRIAGITLKISGRIFLDTLSQQELFNLKPFLFTPAKHFPKSTQPVDVRIHMFERSEPAISSRRRKALVAIVASRLSLCTDKKLKSALFRVVREKMFFYHPRFLSRLIVSIDFKRNDYSLVAKKNFLGLYLHPSRRFDVFMKSPPPHPAEHHNLGVLQLVMRTIFRSTHEGFMLHASCAEDSRKRGVVFAGPSTAGKSTVVAMLGSPRTFTDEFTLIRRQKERYLVYASPWWNADKKPVFSYPEKPAILRGIFFIQKSGKTSLRKMGYKESLATLVCRENNLRMRGFTDDKNSTLAFYLFAQRLVASVPFFQLKVKKGPSFKADFMRLTSAV